jgi:hypothetical protein
MIYRTVLVRNSNGGDHIDCGGVVVGVCGLLLAGELGEPGVVFGVGGTVLLGEPGAVSGALLPGELGEPGVVFGVVSGVGGAVLSGALVEGLAGVIPSSPSP